MRMLVHGLAGTEKGGIEVFILSMSSHMSDEVVFDYVIEQSKKKPSIVIPGNGETLTISPKKRMLSNLIDWCKLLKSRRGIDSLVYFNWYSMTWLFPAIIARFYRYKVIIHAHNNKLHDCGFLQKLMHNLNRQVQKALKITRLTNSVLSAKFFFDNCPSTLVYNAIDIQRFTYNEEIREKMRTELGVSERNVYGFSGRISYQKNPLFLMDVFYEIKKRDNNAYFIVCGDGELIQKTKTKAEELNLDILFAGSVKNMEDYYQAMDCYILPSRFEGLGIVLIEAQCSGLPCITSKDVVPEIAKATDLLHFVTLNDNAHEWAEMSIALAKNKTNRNVYSEVLKKSRFNISVESEYLKSILLGVDL